MDETTTTVRAVREVGPDAVAIDLETPAGFDARPGQFVNVTLPVDGEESRFYTVSSPDVTDVFEITIGIDPEGVLAPHLAALEPGDEVAVAGPYGRDYYEGEARVVVLAGGPGVGPAVGIAERALEDGGEAAVVYRDDDPIHEARLTALANRGAFVRVLDPDEALEDAVADALAAGRAPPQLFVYGFADFIDDVTAAIDAAGGDAEGAKIENFG
ncbi:MAG: FAD-dependent oxidoreductase [Haloarculaceae archaeon]